jgi:hypothetical protein
MIQWTLLLALHPNQKSPTGTLTANTNAGIKRFSGRMFVMFIELLLLVRTVKPGVGQY